MQHHFVLNMVRTKWLVYFTLIALQFTMVI